MRNMLHDLLPAGLMALATMATVAWLTLFAIKDGDPVAVIFPPWMDDSDAYHAIISTGSLIIRTGMTSNILIVQPSNGLFSDNIRALGAWAVVNPFNITTCGTGTITT